MVKVMASGVFDILHLGHVHFLTEAKKLGTELTVVVARDATVRKTKHREPIVPELLRVQMVEALKPVDKAVLGGLGDIYEIVKELKPDIIVLGHDQTYDPKTIEEECAKRGMQVKVVRIKQLSHDLLATRRIIEKILSMSKQSNGLYANKSDEESAK